MRGTAVRHSRHSPGRSSSAPQSADSEEIYARRRQLDRERQAVESAADIGHDRDIGIAQLERTQARHSALGKQLDGREAERSLR